MSDKKWESGMSPSPWDLSLDRCDLISNRWPSDCETRGVPSSDGYLGTNDTAGVELERPAGRVERDGVDVEGRPGVAAASAVRAPLISLARSGVASGVQKAAGFIPFVILTVCLSSGLCHRIQGLGRFLFAVEKVARKSAEQQ